METKRKSLTLPVVKIYFSLLMILVYVTAGFSILLLPQLLAGLSPVHKLPLGLTLIGYGIYRFVKWLGQVTHSHE